MPSVYAGLVRPRFHVGGCLPCAQRAMQHTGASGALSLDSFGVTASSATTYALNETGAMDQIPPGSAKLASSVVTLAQNWHSMSNQQQTDAVMDTMAAAATNVPGYGLIIAGVLEGLKAVMDAVGFAQGGPGECGTDTSKPFGPGGPDQQFRVNEGPGDSPITVTFRQLLSYGGPGHTYPFASCDCFEAYAQRLLVSFFDQNVTCWRDPTGAFPALLRIAVDAWNKTHSSAGTAQMVSMPVWDGTAFSIQQVGVPGTGGTRTLRYTVNIPSPPCSDPSFCPPFGGAESSDPIAVALNALAIVSKSQPGKRATSADDCLMPINSTIEITVNNGPAIPAPLPIVSALHNLGFGASSALAASAAPPQSMPVNLSWIGGFGFAQQAAARQKAAAEQKKHELWATGGIAAVIAAILFFL